MSQVKNLIIHLQKLTGKKVKLKEDDTQQNNSRKDWVSNGGNNRDKWSDEDKDMNSDRNVSQLFSEKGPSFINKEIVQKAVLYILTKISPDIKNKFKATLRQTPYKGWTDVDSVLAIAYLMGFNPAYGELPGDGKKRLDGQIMTVENFREYVSQRFWFFINNGLVVEDGHVLGESEHIEEDFKPGEVIGKDDKKKLDEVGVPIPAGPYADKDIYQIAQIIQSDWSKQGKGVNYAAKPYLDAMRSLTSLQDMYGADSGASIVTYFLSNANTWKGDTAKAVKLELNKRLKEYYKR
jgi:hypothetical protein